MRLVRKHIRNIVPYKAGKHLDETKRELGLKEVIKLASNENALGTSPKAIQAIKKSLKSINRYPDSYGFYLKEKLASIYGVESKNIVLGNGSDELIDIIIKTFVEEDENIITADVTFLEYEITALAYGRQLKTIPLKNFKYDLPEILKNTDQKTKLVFVANPNNPTGTYVNKQELDDFIKKLPADTILVLDEAYDTFIDVNDYPKGLDYIKNNNVIVLKTFSKAYGLAGLRIGYAICDSQFSTYMEKSRQPFNVNLLAQEAALAALDDKLFLRKTRKKTLEGKKFLYDNFKKLGLNYIPSETNFILVDVKRDSVLVFKDLLKKGVIVRDMEQYGLANYVRITIGNKPENKKLIRALKEVTNQ